MYLPEDKIMLQSVLNTLLRDKYADLSQLCEGEDVEEAEVDALLQKHGLRYQAATNRVEE